MAPMAAVTSDAMANRIPLLKNCPILSKWNVKRAALLPQMEGKDKQVLRTAMDLKAGSGYEFRELFELLYSWCRDMMIRL